MREPRGRLGRPFPQRMVIGIGLGCLLLTLSCGREITGPPGATKTSAPIALLAQFPQLPGQASLSSGVEYARVRATLLRLGGDVATDRIVDFPPSADSIALSLTAPFGSGATADGEEMVLLLRFVTASGDTVFRSGPDTIFVEPARAGVTPTPVVVEPVYVGPGAQATRVVLSESDLTVLGTAGAVFTAQAFDAQDAPVPNAPILFSSSDTTLVRFADPRSGAATTVARRDSARVFATLLTGASDSAVLRVTLPAAALTAVSGDAQTAAAGVPLAAPVRVRVTASDAVPVEGVAVTFGVLEGAVGAASVLTDASGEASTSWTLGPSVGTQTLTASVPGLSGSAVNFTATATSGAAVALEFTADPVSAVAGLSLGSITVTARDAQSNVASTFTDSVTLSIANNVAGGVLGGVRTVAAVGGVAVFTGLTVDRAGSGYTLTASASGLSGVTSAAFDITPAAALSLAFVVQPPSVAVNAILAPAVEVEARDAFGNRATGFTGDVTLAFGDNPGGAALGGTLVVTASDGLATFSDLTVDVIAAGYTLEATAVALTAATSTTFNAVAELIAWTNASGGLWSIAANWSLSRVPIATDSVVIALDGTYSVTMDVDFAGSHLAVGAGTGVQTLGLTNRTLELAGSLQLASGGRLSANNSTLSGTGILLNSGSLSLRASNVVMPLDNNGLVVINASVGVLGSMTTTAASVIRMLPDGSTGNATLSVASSFSNFGLIELSSSVGAYTGALVVSAGILTNEASGTIRSAVGTGGTRALNAAVTNLGVIDIDQPLTWTGVSVAQINQGSISVDANLTITQSGTAPSFANLGGITVGLTATLSVAGGSFTQTPTSIGGTGILGFTGVTLALPTAFTTAGLSTSLVNTTVTGAGSLTNDAGRTLNLSGSTLNLPTANDGLVLLDASNSFGVSYAASAGSILRFAAGGSTGFAALSTVGFTNHGAIELSATTGAYSAQLSVSSGTLVNSPSGSITSFVATGGARTLVGSVDNQGSIIVQQPLQWNSTNTVITNGGTLDVIGANLTITQAGSAQFVNTGSVDITAGRAMLISGGSIAENGGSYAGTGALSFLNLTVGGTGTLTIPASRALAMRGVTVTAPLVNEGLLQVDGSNALQGSVTASGGSTIRMLPTGGTGNSTLTVATGFSNFGLIELTASVGAYTAALVVSTGTLTNEASGTIRSAVATGGPRSLNAAVVNAGTIVIDHPLAWNGVSAAQVNNGSIAVNANLTITQTGTAPTFTNLGAITIAPATAMSVTGGSFTQTPTSLSGSGTLVLSGATLELQTAFTSAGLTTSLVNTTVTGAGSLTNSVGRTLNIRGATLNLPVVNEGLLLVDGGNTFGGSFDAPVGSTLRFAAGGSTGFAALSTVGFTNHGAIELSATTGVYSAQLTVTSGTLVNSASGNISSLVGTGGARTLVGSVDNQGAIIVQQPLQWNSANTLITHSGTLDVTGANLTITQTGTASFATSGIVNIAAGRTLFISGGSIAQDGGVYTGTGALSFLNLTVDGSSTLTVPATRALALRGVTVTVPLVNDGLLQVDGSNSLQGSVTASAGSTIRLLPTGGTGNSTLTVATGFSNFGLIELTSSVSAYTAALVVSEGTLTNEASGTIRSAVGTGGPRSLSAAVTNLGLIDIAHPLTWNGVSTAQVNSGSVAVDANLTIVQSGTAPSFANGGSITIAAAATMLVNGGTFTQTTTSIGGTGQLAFNGATLELPTAFITENLTTSLVNTAVNGAGSLTNSDPQTLSIRGSTISLPFVNEGLLLADGVSTISGSIATLTSSIIRLLPTGFTGFSNLTVAGFTNAGSIELTSSVTSYSSQLTISGGALINAASGSISVLPGTGGARTLVGAVDNQGGISIQHPLTWNAPDANITIAGALNVIGGNLSIVQSGSALFTVAGTVDIAAARVLTIAGGGLTQASGGFIGTGVLNLNNLSVSGPGALINPAIRTLNLRNTSIGAPFTNAGLLNVIQASTIGGALSTVGGSTIRIAADGSAGASSLTVNGSFTNEGAIELTSTVSTYPAGLTISGGTLTNAPGGSIVTLPGTGGSRSIVGQVDNQGTISIQQPTVWTATSVANQNNGLLDVSSGNLTIEQSGDASFTTDGTVQVGAGRILRISGGTYAQTGGGFSGSGEIDLQAATVSGTSLTVAAGFSMRLRQVTMNAALVNDGFVWVASASSLNGGVTTSPGSTIRIASDGSTGSSTLSVANNLTNTGTLELSSTLSTYSAALDLGTNTLTNGANGLITVPRATGGVRNIIANVMNEGQFTISADGANALGITGSLTNSGTIAMDVGGLNPGTQYDRITVSGPITLGGTLNVTLFGAFVPVSPNSFTLLQSSTSVGGTFATANLASPLSPAPTYGATSVTVAVP